MKRTCIFNSSPYLAMLLLVAGACLPACGQSDAPELKLNPLVALRELEPATDAPYTLGRGDEISIDFAGRPELDSKRIVGPDGRITLPLAGAIELAGKTREQAAGVVVAALNPYYTNLAATVGVDKYTSNHVLLLGAVERPGIVYFDQPPTLLEVITRGGGLASGMSGGNNSNGGGFGGGVQARAAPAIPDRCAIYRGSDKVVWVDLKQLIDQGDALADLRLRRDDVVYVPSPSERYVSVIGQVQHPGALQLDSNTTLVKLIAEAGGLTPQAGRAPDIRLYSSVSGTTRVIPYKQMLGPAKLDLTLKTGDVILVPESGFNSFTYAIERLSPLVSVFTTAAFFTR